MLRLSSGRGRPANTNSRMRGCVSDLPSALWTEQAVSYLLWCQHPFFLFLPSVKVGARVCLYGLLQNRRSAVRSLFVKSPWAGHCDIATLKHPRRQARRNLELGTVHTDSCAAQCGVCVRLIRLRMITGGSGNEQVAMSINPQ